MRALPLGFLVVVLMIQLAETTVAQESVTVVENSDLQFLLDKNELRNFVIPADSGDQITLNIKAASPVNLMITNADGAVEFVKYVFIKPMMWCKRVDSNCEIKVDVENMKSWSKNRVHLEVTKIEGPFLNDLDERCEGMVEKNVVTSGEVRVKNADPTSFIFSLLKGDTLVVDLSPKSGKTPSVTIADPTEQWKFARRPSKKSVSCTLIAVLDGDYQMDLSARKLFRILPYPFKQITSVRVKKMEAPRNTPTKIEVDTNDHGLNLDTITEIYLDTSFSLGAYRNPLQANRAKISINFVESEQVLCWGLIYGTGQKFTNELNELDSIIREEGKYSDPLEAFCLGQPLVLPRSIPEALGFSATPDIEDALAGRNFGKVEFFDDESIVVISNQSQSIGQKVRLRVVVLRVGTKQ